MERIEAVILLRNLVSRIERDEEGIAHLPGRMTDREQQALELALACLDGRPSEPVVTAVMPPLTSEKETQAPKVSETIHVDDSDEPGSQALSQGEDDPVFQPEVLIRELDASVLSLEATPANVRLCLDFGTAMSKATLVDDDSEEIHVLPLGEHGDQEVINEPLMLVSSIYIDNSGVLWFGHQAVERCEEEDEGGNRDRIDSVKASLSDDGLDMIIDDRFNPTDLRVTYRDMVLANLMFLTWAVNHCVEDLGYPRNVRRRFAMPALSGERHNVVSQTLANMLGNAQVLADTYYSELPTGILLSEFLALTKKLQEESYQYPFIAEQLTEPLGVAGSRMSFKNDVHSTFLVIDVGAGTADFGLFKLGYNASTKVANAAEAEGSALALTEAGNHLDGLLLEFILAKAGIGFEDPVRANVEGRLRQQIRSLKETLFNEHELGVFLANSEVVDVTLNEFLNLDSVQQFESDIKNKVREIFSNVDPSWVQSIPHRRLGVVLTGGGAQLPMVKKAANGTVSTEFGQIELVEAIQYPNWLQDAYPELEDDYPRVAVSLGGARKRLILGGNQSRITAGDVKGKPVLDGYYTKGQ